MKTNLWHYITTLYLGAAISIFTEFSAFNSWQWWAIVVPVCFFQVLTTTVEED
jgi:hypothetical protein